MVDNIRAEEAPTPMNTDLTLVQIMRNGIGMLAATGLGLWPAYVLPFLIGAFMEGMGLSAFQAGILGTAELLAIFLVSLFGSRLFGKGYSHRSVAMFGAIVTILGYIGSLLSSSFETLIITRAVVGGGEGLAMAAGTAAVSFFRQPERVYGYVMMGRALAGAFMMPAIALVIEDYSLQGAFVFMMILPVILFPLFLFLPAQQGETSQKEVLPEKRKHDQNWSIAVWLLVGVLMLTLIESFSYAFLERRGVELGIDLATIGTVIGISTLGTLFGAGVPILLAKRIGQKTPIIAGIVLFTLTSVWTLLTQSSFAYGVLITAFSFFYAACVPYCVGMASGLDKNGVWAAAAGSMLVGGHAIGPTIAGYIMGLYGFPGLASLIGVWGLVAIITFIFFFKWFGRFQSNAV